MHIRKSALDVLYFSHVSFVGFLFAKCFMIHYFHDIVISCWMLPLECYTKLTAVNDLNLVQMYCGEYFGVRLGDHLIFCFIINLELVLNKWYINSRLQDRSTFYSFIPYISSIILMCLWFLICTRFLLTKSFFCFSIHCRNYACSRPALVFWQDKFS